MKQSMLNDAVMIRTALGATLGRVFSLLPLMLVLCGIIACAAIGVSAEDQRGEAQVAIICNTTTQAPDEISIRLMKNTDKTVIDQIAQTLITKLNTQPQDVHYTEKNEDFPDDSGLAITIKAFIVPRGEGYLPIAPFVEAFSPYAKRLRVIYDVKGNFIYRGYRNPYADNDVSFTVKTPPADATNPYEAFYAIDANIKNPSLTSVAFLNYPEQGRKPQPWKYSRLALAIGTAIIILALGFILAFFLPQRKGTVTGASETVPKDEVSTGGSHD